MHSHPYLKWLVLQARLFNCDNVGNLLWIISQAPNFPSPLLTFLLGWNSRTHHTKWEVEGNRKESPLHKYRLPKQCNAYHTEGVTLGEGAPGPQSLLASGYCPGHTKIWPPKGVKKPAVLCKIWFISSWSGGPCGSAMGQWEVMLFWFLKSLPSSHGKTARMAFLELSRSERTRQFFCTSLLIKWLCYAQKLCVPMSVYFPVMTA